MLRFIYFLIRYIMPILRLIFFDTVNICCFQFKLQSIITPRYFILSFWLIAFLSSFKVTLWLRFLWLEWKIKKLVLVMFKANQLTLSHRLNTCFSSSLTTFSKTCKSSYSKYKMDEVGLRMRPEAKVGTPTVEKNGMYFL